MAPHFPNPPSIAASMFKVLQQLTDLEMDMIQTDTLLNSIELNGYIC